MKEALKCAQDTNVKIEWNWILNMHGMARGKYQRNNPLKAENPLSVRGTSVLT